VAGHVAGQDLPEYPQGAPAARAPSFAAIAAVALLVAVLKSTQFLFQPFVWQNWSVGAVLIGWADLARDNGIVAVAMALMLRAVLRRRMSGKVMLAITAAAAAAGALFGEWVLMIVDRQAAAVDTTALLARVVRWAMIAGILALAYVFWRKDMAVAAGVRWAARRRARADRALAAAQLQALRRQIEPHFLFNTLATIRQMAQSDPKSGQRLLSHLLNFVRRTLVSAEETRSTLGQEIELSEAYLGVYRERLGGRMTFTVAIGDDLKAIACPPLTVATLVENAIKHGISPSVDGGHVSLTARRDGDAAIIDVADTGAGFSGLSGNGTGLANIRARLAALYGPAAGCELQANAPRGVIARLRLPIEPVA